MLSPLMAKEVIDEEASDWAAAVVILVVICTLISNFMERFNTAYWFSSDSILAIFIGFLASLPFCSPEASNQRPEKDFDNVFFLYLVPSIIFHSGYSLNQKDFFRNFTAIFLLAVFGTILSSILTGLSLFYLASTDHIIGINATSPKEGLLVGSLLSATDPVATLAVFGSLDVDPQLYALVFGESVLNDAVAIVLFQTFDQLPDQSRFHVSAAEVVSALARFTAVGIGSLVCGLSFGAAAAFITNRVLRKPHEYAEVTIMLCVPYLSFIAADSAGLSGLMAIFFCGVMMSHYARYNLSERGGYTTHHVTHTLAHVSELLTFLYFGFTILPMIAQSCDVAENQDVYVVEWRFIGYTLLLCFVTRALHVIPITLILNFCLKRHPSQAHSRLKLSTTFMLWFSGLRGAIAFALSLTIDSPNRKYIIPCVVMVVLFTNIILGQGTAPLLKLLNIPMGVTQQQDHGPESEQIEDRMPRAQTGPRVAVPPRGKYHVMWRRLDERYIKPVLGGRTLGYRRQSNDGSESLVSMSSPLAPRYCPVRSYVL